MNDFKELKAPVENYRGWYVCTKYEHTGENPAWLTTNGDITSCTDILDILHFDTEEEAYQAALVYYSKHNEVYPYTMTATFGTMGNDVNESQVMEFE